MEFAERTIVCRDPLAIARVLAGFHLIDAVPHEQRVILRGAENERLLLDQMSKVTLTNESFAQVSEHTVERASDRFFVFFFV